MAKYKYELVYLADRFPNTHVLLTYLDISFQLREYTPTDCRLLEVAPSLRELRLEARDSHRMDPHRVDDVPHWWAKVQQINMMCSLTKPDGAPSG